MIEKAVDNDAGVLAIRFLVALLTGLATIIALERVLREPGDSASPEDFGRPVEPNPEGSPSPTGTSSETEEEATRQAEDARAIEEHMRALARERQAYLKARSRKIKINP